MAEERETLLEVKDLEVTYGSGKKAYRASETSVSTRSGLAPGYTVTTIRYGVLTSGSRFVFILVIDTKPSISTMMTATSTVNGFLTLNFSILSYRFSAAPPGATVPPSLGAMGS